MKRDNDNQRPAIVANSEPLRFLSVCSGIEAASVAWPQWQAVAFSEIEKFPSAVLAHHYPDVPNLGDSTKIDTAKLGRVDILCGGTPCQAFSVAGKREGLADARGNLTLSFVELAHELADGNGLRNVVWENVPGVLSSNDNAFGCFLAGLVGADAPLVSSLKRGRWPDAGMVAGPEGRSAWRILDAQYFGLAQRRRRVIVVADFGSGADPAEVLFEREGVRRDSPPSREAGEGVAGASAQGFGSSGEYAPEIARCVATREGSSQDYETTTMVAQTVAIRGREGGATAELGGDVATALRASQGGGDKPHVLAFDTYNQDTAEVTHTLRRGSGNGDAIPAVLTSAVRRLTPVECERLQGFPDNYTAIPWRNKPAEECPDGPRYKALGNSWAVPLFVWLGKRIDKHMPQLAAHNNKDTTIADAA